VSRDSASKLALHLIFGGESGDTLFVLTHHTSYSVQPLKAARRPRN